MKFTCKYKETECAQQGRTKILSCEIEATLLNDSPAGFAVFEFLKTRRFSRSPLCDISGTFKTKMENFIKILSRI